MFGFEDIFRHLHGEGGGHGGGGHEDEAHELDPPKLYKVLNLQKGASTEDIKKAWKKARVKLHPDRHPDEHDKYQHLFQEAQTAWEILENESIRNIYDEHGYKAAKQALMRPSRGGRGGDPGQKQAPSVKRALDVTLEDLYKGATKTIKIERYVATDTSKKCPRCDGQGVMTVIQRMGPMVLQSRQECGACKGVGYGLDSEEATVKVQIPTGGRHGEQVKIPGEGHQFPDHAPGDLVVQLRQQKHDVFTRQGADLGMKHTLSLRQALLGFEIKIPHVNGHTLIVKGREGEVVQPGSLKCVHTYGMPQRFNPHVKGHLYIVMDVEMPDLTGTIPALMSKLSKALPDQDDLNQEMLDDIKQHDEEAAKPKKKNVKKNKKKKKKGPETAAPKDDIVEEVECSHVDADRIKATPAAAKGSYDEDDERDGVQCHQM